MTTTIFFPLSKVCESVRDVSDPRRAPIENQQSPHSEFADRYYSVYYRGSVSYLYSAPGPLEKMIVEQEKAAENSNASPALQNESTDLKKRFAKGEWRGRYRVQLLL